MVIRVDWGISGRPKATGTSEYNWERIKDRVLIAITRQTRVGGGNLKTIAGKPKEQLAAVFQLTWKALESMVMMLLPRRLRLRRFSRVLKIPSGSNVSELSASTSVISDRSYPSKSSRVRSEM